MPPSESTATSVVPPPTSTTIEPLGSAIGRAPPAAAARGPPHTATSPGPAPPRGPRRAPGVVDRALLDVGRTRRRAHDHTRVREAALPRLADEVAQHLLG